MLRIVVGSSENYDESSSEFVSEGGTAIELEHSLLSVSKWESEFEKPFLEATQKTGEEVLGYIRCMCLTPDTPPEVFHHLSEDNIREINAYIDAKMTATWFNETRQSKSGEVITSELVYYWMSQFQIPFECENWHLNRLFTLLRICNIKQDKPKKMSHTELAVRNRELNAQRRERFNTTG